MAQLQEFILKFRQYCRQKYPSDSGTALSYTNAIKYLFDFMGADDIDSELIIEIKSLEPDIRNVNSVFYGELADYFEGTGRSSYLEKGFLKAALQVLFNYSETDVIQSRKPVVLLKEIRDSQINAEYITERLKHEFPLAESLEHSYTVKRVSGTSQESARKIFSGRRAEKYFISYLKSLGFEENRDFFDVANNKNYGYDIRFAEFGLEVKNIKSGSFFLSDNEIAY